jgi:hypothetical protein
VFCTRCGHDNPDDSHFCSNCGVPLGRPGQPLTDRGVEATSTISLTPLDSGADADGGEEAEGDVRGLDLIPAGTALLVVKRGPNAGSRFLLDKDMTTAGRHPESDIFLDDVTVSRRHAEFHRDGTGFTVRDVGSLNGTYLNRERIETVTLADGDEVQIGKFRLAFLTGAAGPAPT